MVKENASRLFGLVGFPLGHSFSSGFFTEKFRKEEIDARYLNFEIENLDRLPNIIAENPTLVGLNVTIPYKEKIISLLNDVEPIAEKIGAINTIKIYRDSNKDYRLIGFNTDIIGFTESIQPFISENHRSALILGTGGASKAIAAGLRRFGINYTFVSRHRSENAICYFDLTEDIVRNNTVIVNTTPLGMWPNVETAPYLPYDAIGPEHLCFDAVYNPSPTLFLKKCADRGATIVGGLEMLRLQALASWKIWTDE